MVYFLRHGESEANVVNVFSNKGFKHGLTSKGVRQTEELCDKLKEVSFEMIFASPLKRAVETAEILSEKSGAGYFIDERLVEFDVGILEGKSDEKSWNEFKKLWNIWFSSDDHDAKTEDGESLKQIILRFSDFMCDRIQASKTDKNYLVISHGGVLSCALPFFLKGLNIDFVRKNPLKNCGYATAVFCNGEWICEKWGHTVPGNTK